MVNYLKFSSEHGNDTTSCCKNFQNGLIIVMDDMNGTKWTWFEFKMHFVWILYIVAAHSLPSKYIMKIKVNDTKHFFHKTLPDSKVHGADMGPTWGRQVLGGPHVGHVNLAIWAVTVWSTLCKFDTPWKLPENGTLSQKNDNFMLMRMQLPMW